MLKRFALVLGVIGMAACANTPTALDLVLCESGSGPECVDGMLALSVSGLPDGLNPSLVIRGPNGFRMTANASQTFQLISGEYTIEALPVEGLSSRYDPETAMQTVMVSGETSVEVKYVEVPQAH